MGRVSVQAVCTALAAVVLTGILTSCCPGTLYELLAAPPVVRLPLDESPHCDGGEWWYYTGRVTTGDGNSYGIEAVIFHVPRLPIRILDEAFAAHFAVLDEATGALAYEQTRSVERANMVERTTGGFDLYTPLVQVTGEGGEDHVHAAMQSGPYAIDLVLRDERGVVLHGGDGYVPYGADGYSFYYSRPRMRASGVLQINGKPREVSGEFWFDRQWGLSLMNPWLQWDWFSHRFDDGADVMLYVFRGTSPPVALGTYVPSSGEPLALTADDFRIAPTASWTSPHTKITYPAAWDIHIARLDTRVTVTPVTNDQELDARATTLNIYWEGLCVVRGMRGGQPADGVAYVELTNYP